MVDMLSLFTLFKDFIQSLIVPFICFKTHPLPVSVSLALLQSNCSHILHQGSTLIFLAMLKEIDLYVYQCCLDTLVKISLQKVDE